MHSASQEIGRKLKRSSDFKHFLWRRHPHRRVLDGALPEVISTDGETVRRILSQQKQIIFQEFEDQQTASALINRIESSVVPGVAMVGYSMFKERDAVAILHTGRNLGPGWLAFPDTKRKRAAGMVSPTLPLRVVDQPKLRLVAGASVVWDRRDLVIKGAVEQRGSQFASTPRAFDLLEHLADWKVEAVFYKNDELKRVDLCESGSPRDGISRVHSSRREACFVIDPLMYKQMRQLDAQVWFRFTFDRELFCLPVDWSSFWMMVDLAEAPGVLM